MHSILSGAVSILKVSFWLGGGGGGGFTNVGKNVTEVQLKGEQHAKSNFQVITCISVAI